MQRNLLLLGVGAVLTLAFQWSQGTPLRGDSEERPEIMPLAVLNMSEVFKQNALFKQDMDTMKSDVDLAEGNLAVERRSVEEQEKKLAELDPASNEYRDLEGKILVLKSDFNLDMTQQRQGFLNRERDIYFREFERTNSAVQTYCSANGIRLVVRISEETPKQTPDREEVLRLINRQIVYQDRLDITPQIIDALNRSEQSQP